MAKGEAIVWGGRERQRLDRLAGSPRSIPIVRDDDRELWILALGLGGLIVAWIGAIFRVEQARFVGLVPQAQAVGIEAASTLALLFAGLILFLFHDPRTEPRVRWLVVGFLVLGLGSLVFGSLDPLLTSRPKPAAYRPILTIGKLLRLRRAVIVAVTGVLELRRVAVQASGSEVGAAPRCGRHSLESWIYRSLTPPHGAAGNAASLVGRKVT